MDSLRLNKDDYINILRFYDVNYEKMTYNDIKKEASRLIASNLCKCIKKVTKINKFSSEQPAIAICNNSILKSHNLKYYGFSCSVSPKLKPYYQNNNNKNTLIHTRLMKQSAGPLNYITKNTRRKYNDLKQRKTRRVIKRL
jgi:hypothetical protein